MTGPALGLAWATLVLWAMAAHRPPPDRVALLPRATCRGAAGGPARRQGPLELLGDVALRSLRRPAGDAARDRKAGAVVLMTGVAGVVSPVLLPVPAAGAWALARLTARRREHQRLSRLEADLPDTVDLLVLAVGAGCNVPLAVAAAGRRGTGPLAAELRVVTAAVGRGQRMADALDDLPARAGESVRPLSSALAGCERYGAPLAETLQRLADQVRRQRQRRAEEAARKVPVTLLFPLVLCILPAFALLTVGPLIAGALRELRL